MRKDFVALILTHGRADNVQTYKTLRRCGYTGDIRVVIDDEDDQRERYIQLFGDEVVVFHKAGVKCSTYDNRQERRVILFARNAAFDIAEKLGYRYFVELDDDYNVFTFKFNKELEYKGVACRQLDVVFESFIQFLESVPNCSSIAMAQNGDFIGGGNSNRAKKITLWRKAMNSFVCDTHRRFTFMGRINEDVNTYTLLGSRGELFFTFNMVTLIQSQTQVNKGGMTGAYLDGGTYVKTFYSVIGMPSAVKVCAMGDRKKRIHHNIRWNNCVPLILREEWKK